MFGCFIKHIIIVNILTVASNFKCTRQHSSRKHTACLPTICVVVASTRRGWVSQVPCPLWYSPSGVPIPFWYIHPYGIPDSIWYTCSQFSHPVVYLPPGTSPGVPSHTGIPSLPDILIPLELPWDQAYPLLKRKLRSGMHTSRRDMGPGISENITYYNFFGRQQND